MVVLIRLISACLALLLVSTLAEAEQLVVIASSHDSLRPGSLVHDHYVLRLELEQSVTMVANDGRTIRVEGPYRGPAMPDTSTAGAEGGLAKTLSNLILNTTNGLQTLAVFRGPNARKAVWVIRMHSPGTYCTGSESEPRFSRRRASLDARLTLYLQSQSEESSVTWPAGQSRLTLSSNVSIEPGAMYTAELRDARESTHVTIYVLPVELPSDVHRVAWMAERGCIRQARQLLEIIAREAPR